MASSADGGTQQVSWGMVVPTQLSHPPTTLTTMTALPVGTAWKFLSDE